MKIVITQPSSRQMQQAISLMKERLETNHQNASQNDPFHTSSNFTVEIWDSNKPQITCADIKKSEADLFVCFDLAGFEQSTLTDGIAYNLLDCKQIHILLEKELTNEKYLAKQLSISMFFYCADAEYFRYLQEKYPDIPYLKAIEGWKRDGEEGKINAEICGQVLFDIVWEVIRLCRTCG